MIEVMCVKCNKKYFTYKSRVKPNKKNYCSRYCFHVANGENNSGEKSSTWKGDNIGYSMIHVWLREHFGKASMCESKSCKNISKKFVYALKKGKEYRRDRNNFMTLCISCHTKYDMNDNWREKMRIAQLGSKKSYEIKKKMSEAQIIRRLREKNA